MAEMTPSILLTRPRADAQGFAELLRAQGVTAPIEMSPIVEIVTTDAFVDFEGVSGVVFSSRNAVASVPGQDLPAWCVGTATAEVARAKGWHAAAADGDAEALYGRVLADAPEGPLLHIRGEIARGDLAARLTQAGIETRDMIVYRQESRPLSEVANVLLSQANPVIVPLFSPNAAVQFAAQGPFKAPILIVAMSEAVAQEMGELPRETLVLAEKKEAAAMANAIIGLLDAG